MLPLSRFNTFAIILCGLILIAGCKKIDSSNNNNNNNNNNNSNLPPAVTPVGIPIDDPVTKTIGASGGSIVSEDGVVELNIPAGALSSNTDISIQPVTNEAPGGIGLSYHLMPDGTKFSIPAKLMFHYTDKEISGSLPYLLYIAYQDSANIWRADLVNRNVDTVAKTASLDISHFSIWSAGEFLALKADVDQLQHDEKSHLRVVQTYTPPTDPNQTDDELPELPVESPVDDKYVLQWRIDGALPNGQNGTFDGGGSHMTYGAPSTIDEEKTVQISARLRFSAPMYNNGRVVVPIGEAIVFKNITLLPETFEYHLLYEYDRDFLGTPNQEYSDKAEMDITVKGSDVTISNITNVPAAVIPASIPVGLCTNTYLTGPNGLINVTNAVGFTGTSINPDYKNKRVFEIRLAEDSCYDAGWDFSCPPNSGLSTHLNPKLLKSFTTGFIFVLEKRDSTTVYDPNGQERTFFKLTAR